MFQKALILFLFNLSICLASPNKLEIVVYSAPVFKSPDENSIVLERLKKGDQVLERGNKLSKQDSSLGSIGFFHVVTKAGTVGFIKPDHAAPHNFQATKENIFDETDYNQRMNLRHQESSTQYHSKILFLGSFPKAISTPTNGKNFCY